MIAGPEKPDAVSITSGFGRVGARTIAVGGQVIVIDNIGTIRILRGQRSWWLFVLGAVVIAGAATQLSVYGALAIAGIGLGAVLILGNLAQKVESGLSIGTADHRSTLIVSRDEIFLQRLLQLLADKIDSGDETLLANFDIARGAITAVGASVAVGGDVFVSGQPLAQHRTAEPAAPPVVLSTEKPEPEFRLESPAEGDDGLFADTEPAIDDLDQSAALEGPAQPDPSPPSQIPAQAERREDFDPLLDRSPRRASDNDWLSRRHTDARPHAEPGSGVARVLVALLIVVLLGAGVFAAWYFTGETAPGSSISLTESPGGPDGGTRR